MRRLQKNSPGSAIRDAPREPMAEGAIPLRKNGIRKWSSMTDSQLIQHARGFMKEKGITIRSKLFKADRGLYRILHKRDLLAKVCLGKNHRKRRDWLSMTDSQLIEHTLEFAKEKGITRIGKLREADHGLEYVLRKRMLVGKAGFIQKKGKCTYWSSMTDSQLIRHAKDFMKERGINGKYELEKVNAALHSALRRRKLLSKVGLEQKKREPRAWSSISDGQLIQHAKDFMKEKGITGRAQLKNADEGLYSALCKRKLLAEISFEQKRREDRDWQSMTDSELIQHAQDFMKEKGITGRKQLDKADTGLYEILRRRDLLSAVFADLEQSKSQSLESELVSGLRQAADAMQEFGGEKE